MRQQAWTRHPPRRDTARCPASPQTRVLHCCRPGEESHMPDRSAIVMVVDDTMLPAGAFLRHFSVSANSILICLGYRWQASNVALSRTRQKEERRQLWMNSAPTSGVESVPNTVPENERVDGRRLEPGVDGTKLSALIGLFYADQSRLGNFGEIDASSLPATPRRLLAHNQHMTVVLEAHYRSRSGSKFSRLQPRTSGIGEGSDFARQQTIAWYCTASFVWISAI